MNSSDLNSFFSSVSYDWKKDAKDLTKICYLTKSRVSQDKDKQFSLSYGMEQPFLIKAIAEHKKSKNFFEIGTGRGTACYTVSLVDSIERIDTVDIIPPSHKRAEAIGYEPALVSNLDLFEMVPYEQKRKINFHERHNVSDVIRVNKSYDLLFIDGNHTDYNVIFEDFEICRLLASDDAVIIWDDYYPDKFAIKDVLAAVVKKYGYDVKLIESRGHLFTSKPPEQKCGTVIMSKKGYNEDIFSQG